MAIERYHGDQALISWAPESTFGSKASSVDRFFAATNLDVGTSTDNDAIQLADQTRTPHTMVYGVEESGGSIPGRFMDGRIFKIMLGDPTTTSSGETGNSNKHTYDNSTKKFKPVSFTTQVDMNEPSGRADLNRHILGCVGTNLEISIPEGAGAIEYTLDYEAQEDTVVSDGSLDAVESFSSREPFKVSETTYSAEGSNRQDIIEATVNIESGSEKYFTTKSSNSHIAELISPGSLTFTIDLEVLFEDTYWRDKIKNRNKVNKFTIDIEKSNSNRDDHIIMKFTDLTVDEAPYNIPEEGELQDTVTLSANNVVVTVHDDFAH